VFETKTGAGGQIILKALDCSVVMSLVNRNSTSEGLAKGKRVYLWLFSRTHATSVAARTEVSCASRSCGEVAYPRFTGLHCFHAVCSKKQATASNVLLTPLVSEFTTTRRV